MLTLSSLYLFFSCSTTEKEQEALEGFRIKGVARGLADSSWIFLDVEGKVVDSSLVVKEKFSLKGEVNDPIQGMLKSRYLFLLQVYLLRLVAKHL